MNAHPSPRSARPTLAPWLLAALLAAPAAASAGFSSSSSVETPAGFVQDSGGASSAVTIDAENFARSFVRPDHASLGAGASNSHAGYSSFSRSSFDDAWSCVGPCGTFPHGNGIVPLTLDFNIDGVLTNFGRHGDGTGEPSAEILASYTIGVLGEFDFRLQENVFDSSNGPLGAGSSGVYAQFCRQGGSCQALPMDIVAFTDGDDNDRFSFSLHAHLTQVMCPNCAAGFVDGQFIQAQVTSGGDVAMVDALHTFTVGVSSEDPYYQFVSANGRSTAAVPPVSAVPEPETLPLLLAGIAAIGMVVRRRTRSLRAT